MAARNPPKLGAALSAVGDDFELVEVDISSADAMRSVAERTRVLFSTVAPYIRRTAHQTGRLRIGRPRGTAIVGGKGMNPNRKYHLVRQMNPNQHPGCRAPIPSGVR